MERSSALPKTRAPHKTPHGVMRNRHTSCRQFRRQGAYREIGLLGKPGKQPVPGFACQNQTAGTSDPAPSRALPLSDPHR